MGVSLLGLSLSIAAIDWLAVAKSWKRIEFIAKPLMMVFLLAWLASFSALPGPLLHSPLFKSSLLWFALALVFSLAGDVFLMLPRVIRSSPGWYLFCWLTSAISLGLTRVCPGFFFGLPGIGHGHPGCYRGLPHFQALNPGD